MLQNINTHVVLNLSEYRENVVISANHKDLKSRTIVFSFIDDDGDYILPEGIVAYIKGTRPDGAGIWETCKIDGNNVIYEITPYVLSVCGNVKAKISLETEDGGQILSTVAFTIHIPKDPYSDDAIIMTDEFSVLNSLIDKMTVGLQEIEYIKTLAENVEENAQISENAKDIVLEKADEVADNTDEVSEKHAEVLEKTDEVAEKHQEVLEKASEVETNTEIVVEAKDTVLEKADEVADNTDYVEQMKVSVEQSEINVKASEEKADEYKDIACEKAGEASDSADKSEEYYLLSKSYAVGTDSTVRNGDETDNSKYYAEQAKSYMESIQSSAAISVPLFYIDFTTGCLMSETEAKGIEFEIVKGDFIGRMVTE